MDISGQFISNKSKDKNMQISQELHWGNETTNWIRFLDLKIKSESRVQDLYITKDCHYLEEFSEAKTFL